MEFPLISVVIPTYSRPQNLTRAIDSVLAQKYTNYEIIVVDDNGEGTDNQLCTEKALMPYISANKIYYIKHDVNKNGAVARNTGIRIAKGEYVAFLDDDDEWSVNLLYDTAQYMLNKKNVDLFYCQAQVLDVKSKYVLPQRGIKAGESFSDYLFCNRGFMQTSCVIVKRAIAKKKLFNENLRRHQDYDFLLKLEVEVMSIVFIKKPNVIIHWETNTRDLIEKKGGTYSLSLRFAQEYKSYFSRRAYNVFVLNNVVISSIFSLSRIGAIRLLFTHVELGVLAIRDYGRLCYYLFFKRPR